MIVHDQVDRSEWIRAQLAVDAERRRHVPAFPGHSVTVHRVRSDPSLVSVGPSTDWLQSKDDDDEVDWTAVSPELEALCHNRKSTRRHTVQRTLILILICNFGIKPGSFRTTSCTATFERRLNLTFNIYFFTPTEWVGEGRMFPSACLSVCLFVWSITPKRNIPECSNLVWGTE